MAIYKVIWFDDEHRSLNIIREKAFLNDIDLVGFGNAYDGIEELKNNPKKYRAAIVDGKFFQKPGQLGDALNDKALFDVGNFLTDNLPWFILSGQISFTKETNRFADGFNKRVYDKLNEEDLISLWNILKEVADQQDDTKILNSYYKVFEVCDEKYIGVEYQKTLLQILSSIQKPEEKFDDELYFTQIRIMLEAMFRCANKIGLLHDKCIDGKGKVNLTESSLFMAGEPTKYLEVKCAVPHFNKIIIDAVKSILFLTGAASHTVDPEIKNNINLNEYRKTVNTPYLLYSITFQLLDILIWFKKYADENPDKEKNKLLWTSVVTTVVTGDWIPGEVIRIAPNGYGTFQPSAGGSSLSIIPAKVSELSLKEKQLIEVITKPDTAGTKILIHDIRVR